MSKQTAKERIQQRRGQQQRQTQIILIVVVALLALSAVVVLIVLNQPREPLTFPAGDFGGIPESVDQTGGIGLVLGPEDAPVTLTEYSDFSCSHCHALEPTIHKLIDDYVRTGKLKIIYKPVTFVGGPYSEAAARGAICAAAQGKAWEMHDQIWDLYASKSHKAYTPDAITGLAAVVGLDQGKFASCYGSPNTTSAIQSVSDEVLKIGVDATPTLFLDGARLDFNGPDNLIQAVALKVAAASGS